MTQFTFETVDNSVAIRGQSTLALDRSGTPRIAYATAAGVVKLARRDTGTWTFEELPSAVVQPHDEDPVRLAIDSQGNSHVAYLEKTTFGVIHFVNRDNHWQPTTVPTTNPNGVINLSFQLHPGHDEPSLRDTPQFAYHDTGKLVLGYTRMVNGKFVPATIDDREAENTQADAPLFDTGLHSSMAFEPSSDVLRIAYFDLDNHGGLPVQRPFQARIVDIAANIKSRQSPITLLNEDRSHGICASLALAEGRTCVAYVDLTSHAVKAVVLQFDLPQPSHETVAPVTVRTLPSAAQNRGDFRIAFIADGNLKLATRNRFGIWTAEVVDTADSSPPSLAYDNRGNAHIAYVQGHTLRHATRKE
jgi:hypothetical protein